MSATEDLLANNAGYVATFSQGSLPLPPAKRLVVLACMDARLDPAKALGLNEGDAHVIRNAGEWPPTTRCAASSFPSGCSAPRR